MRLIIGANDTLDRALDRQQACLLSIGTDRVTLAARRIVAQNPAHRFPLIIGYAKYNVLGKVIGLDGVLPQYQGVAGDAWHVVRIHGPPGWIAIGRIVPSIEDGVAVSCLRWLQMAKSCDADKEQRVPAKQPVAEWWPLLVQAL